MPNDDHLIERFALDGERELDDDVLFKDQIDDENENEQTKHGLTKEVEMDQAIEKKGVSKTGTPEQLGVAWTEGTYSGKNLRSTCILMWLVTIFFVGIGIYLMVNNKTNTTIWALLLIIPVCAWVYFSAIYFYRTMTIRYRLTQHRFYNEEGLFTKSVDTLELINIEDMTLRQTLVDRVINGGTGTIVLVSNDVTHPKLKIMGLENPRAAFESIDEMRRRERSARVIRSVN